MIGHIFFIIMAIAFQPITLTEEYTMVKYEQFEEISGTPNADLAALANIRNLGHDSSKYLWAEFSGTTLYLKSTPDTNLTGSTSTEAAATFAMDATFTYKQSMFRNWGSEYLLAAVGYKTEHCQIYLRYSDDAGSTWSTVVDNDVTINEVVGNDPSSVALIDLAWGASKSHIIYGVPTSISDACIVWVDGDGETATQIAGAYDSDRVYAGYIENDIYHCSLDFGTEQDYSFDLSAYTVTSTALGISLSASTDLNKQQFWKQNGTEFIINQDQFFVKPYNQTEWQSYTTTGTTAVAIVWDHTSDDMYKINYIIWNELIWKILPSGAIVSFQVWSGAAVIGWSNFTNTGTTIYQSSIIAFPGTINLCRIKTGLFQIPNMSLQCSTEPFQDQYLILYDDSDNQIYEGRVLTYEDNTQYYKYDMLHGLKSDFGEKLDSAYSAKTAHYILKDIIDTYCNYLFYTTNISTTPTDTYTIDFKGKTVLDAIKWACNREGYIFSIRPNNEAYWDQYSASGISINDLTTGVVDLPTVKYTASKYSKITLWGGFVDGVRLKSVGFGEPSYTPWDDWYPEITTQAALDDMLAAILAKKNVSVGQCKVGIIGSGQLNYGQSVNLTLSQYSISGATWYIGTCDYDALIDVSSLLLTDSFMSPSSNLTDEMKPAQNEQDIAVIQSSINSSTGGGITPQSLSVTDDPTDGDGVGNRDYNDARYLAIGDKYTDAEAVDAVEAAGLTMDDEINMNSQTLSNPLDPTAGTHVGDRDYNDARYPVYQPTDRDVSSYDFTTATIGTHTLDLYTAGLIPSNAIAADMFIEANWATASNNNHSILENYGNSNHLAGLKVISHAAGRLCSARGAVQVTSGKIQLYNNVAASNMRIVVMGYWYYKTS